MAGTAATIANLLLQFPIGGGAGGFGAQQIQNLIATLAARTGGLIGGGSFVRVTDPEFGADPTGVADSTTAFQNAMAAGPCLVPALQPNGTSIAQYKLSNCVVPNGATLIGMSAGGFTGGGVNSDVVIRPQILAAPAATRIFNVDGKKGIKFEGLIISGVNSTTPNTCDGISAGGESITLTDVLVQYCRFGLGGAVSGSTATFPNSSWECTLVNANFQVCVTGLGDIVDCFIYGGSCSYNVNGAVLNASQSSANTFHGTRFEWNGRTNAGNTPSPGAVAGSGLLIAGSDTNQFLGCEFDANGMCAVNMTSVAYKNTFQGCSFTRNGTNIPSGTTLLSSSSHVIFNSAFAAHFSGCMSNTGNDGSVWAPANFANFVGAAGANGGIVFVGNDMSGYQGSTAGASNLGPQNSNTTWKAGNVPTASGVNCFILSKNVGTGTAAQDVDTR